MALGALHVLVFAREGEVRRGVLEGLHGLPTGDGVALLAVRSQLPAMLVLMAGETGWMKSFEGPAEVLDFDLLPVGRGNIPGIVELLAVQTGMASD